MHFIESFAQLVFSSDGMYPWHVVNGLVEVHPYEGLGSNRMVSPAKIPVGLFFLLTDLHA